MKKTKYILILILFSLILSSFVQAAERISLGPAIAAKGNIFDFKKVYSGLRCRVQGPDYYYSDQDEGCYRVEEGTILWHGFQHAWDKTPHRLNKFGSYFRSIDYEPNDDLTGGMLTAERRSIFKVGAYDDEGDVKIKGQILKTSVLGIYHDYLDEDCLQVSGDVGDSDSVTCEVSLDLEEIGFEDYDNITVVLRGFQLWSSSYDMGYNSRGFAVRVIPVAQTEQAYTFDAYFYVYPEHSPDRPMWDDDCNDGNHCESYKYEARIYYTVIGVREQDGHVVAASSLGTNSYSQEITMYPFKTPPLASTSLRQAEIQGEPGFEHGIVGIQGFKWKLNSWSSTSDDGRYIRDLRSYITSVDYSSQTGAVDFYTTMYFSNESAWPYGFDVDFTMWNTLIQFNDAQFKKTNPSWYSCTLEKGDTSCTEDVEHEFVNSNLSSQKQ
ncbi:hypothetical protein KJ708_12930 [bacterium]|nr:hypothetical protein [bacterium]